MYVNIESCSDVKYISFRRSDFFCRNNSPYRPLAYRGTLYACFLNNFELRLLDSIYTWLVSSFCSLFPTLNLLNFKYLILNYRWNLSRTAITICQRQRNLSYLSWPNVTSQSPPLLRKQKSLHQARAERKVHCWLWKLLLQKIST